MKQFNDLTNSEQTKIMTSARRWRLKHTLYVDVLAIKAGDIASSQPVGYICFRPSLWKGIHWKWFFEQIKIGGINEN